MTDQRNGGIAWTDTTWNPIRGCSKVSQGCKNCYAETMAVRFSGPGMPYADVITNGRWNGKAVMVPARMADPLRWQRPRLVFVNSMSDLFHESLTNEQIAAVFGVMASAPQHTFQVLTKRPERAREWFAWYEGDSGAGASALAAVYAAREHGVSVGWPVVHNREVVETPWPLPNVWLGVSVEDQKTADERIPLLLQCPAEVRWLSAEPLLGPVSISNHIPMLFPVRDPMKHRTEWESVPVAFGPVVDWVVVGGESGAGYRPMELAWARSLRDECKAAEVPFFMKQIVEHGRKLEFGDFPTDLQVREYPEVTP